MTKLGPTHHPPIVAPASVACPAQAAQLQDPVMSPQLQRCPHQLLYPTMHSCCGHLLSSRRGPSLGPGCRRQGDMSNSSASLSKHPPDQRRWWLVEAGPAPPPHGCIATPVAPTGDCRMVITLTVWIHVYIKILIQLKPIYHFHIYYSSLNPACYIVY